MTDPYRDQDQTHRGEPWNQPPTPGAPGTTSGGVEGQGIPGPGVQGTAVPPPPVPHGDDKSGTGQQAKDSARNVAEDTKQAGGAVAGTAKDEALSVKDDAVREGRKLWDETSSTLSTQASDQLNRAAGTVRTFTDDLARMSRGEKPEDGLATDLAQQVTDRTAALAEWLENREPADVLTEVKSFARRRPVAFLAIAAGLGFAAGRLTRSVAQVHSDDDDQDVWASRTDTAGSYGPGDGQYRATPVPPQPGYTTGGTVPPVDPSVGQAVPGTPGYDAPGQQGYPYGAPVPPAEPTRPVPPRLPETDGRGDIR